MIKGGCFLSLGSVTVNMDGVSVRMTGAEKRMFSDLYNAKGGVVSHRALQHFIGTGMRNTLSRLRSKLYATKFRILSVHGEGYRMVRK